MQVDSEATMVSKYDMLFTRSTDAKNRSEIVGKLAKNKPKIAKNLPKIAQKLLKIAQILTKNR